MAPTPRKAIRNMPDDEPLPRLASCVEKRNPSLTTRKSVCEIADQTLREAVLQTKQRQQRTSRMRMPDSSRGSVYRWEDERLQMTKVITVRLDRAAAVLQRFFLQSRRHVEVFRKQQRILLARLEEIETSRHADFEGITKEIEERKLQAQRELQEDREKWKEEQHQPIQEALAVTSSIMAELKLEATSYKKRSRFLRRCCSELRQENIRICSEVRHKEHLQTSLGCHSKKLPRIIISQMVELEQYQCRVVDHESRFEDAEAQWQSMKQTNKMIRDCMGKIVEAIQQRQPDCDDTWDLVDELHQLRRGTKWKRKCNARVRSGRGVSRAPSAPHSTEQSLPRGSPRPMQGPYFPRNRPRILPSKRIGSNTI